MGVPLQLPVLFQCLRAVAAPAGGWPQCYGAILCGTCCKLRQVPVPPTPGRVTKQFFRRQAISDSAAVRAETTGCRS